ncbi:MAG TPA: SDR family oxidoreductase [Candidatus Methylomirabilis sp.]|nr:SDR family oxidoreductase [Candidatus Methylomirabilis sp.]
MRLDGKAAIVTGAGQGIGRGIALAFAREGADVLVAEVNPETGARTAAEVQALGRTGLATTTDVTRPDQIEAMVETAARTFGHLDILVNNAGVLKVQDLFALGEADWDRTFAVNAKGLFFCLQAAARRMRRQGGGAIVNIASIAGRAGRPIMVDYAATKAAVISITRSAAIALAPHRIRVNAVCPGMVDTAMWEHIDEVWGMQMQGLPKGEQMRRRLKMVPLDRMEEPEDVARAVVFLVSDEADYVTGQALNVCGGLEMD